MRLLLILLSVQLQAQVCSTDWFCTNGNGKTFITPCGSLNQTNYYTEYQLDFGDGIDTTFIGIENPIALCHQTIVHTYDSGVYIATLTASFYDSTTNLLLCSQTKQDAICNPNLTYIKETQSHKNVNKIFDFFGRELKNIPKNKPYIKNNIIYIDKF